MKKNKQPFYPTVGQLIGLFLIYIGFAIPVVLATAGIFALLDYDNMSLQNMIVYTVAGALALWYAWKQKVKLEKDPRVFRFGKVHLLVYLILIPATLSAGIFTDPVSILIPIPDFFLKLFESLDDNNFSTFLMVCICAPVFEELLFRGIVLNGFLKLFNPWKAILLSALFFGLFHLNPWQFGSAFIIGIIIGYIYWKTGSLLPCLYSHWLNNTVYWLLSVLVWKDTESFSELFSRQTWYYALVGLALIVLLSSFYLLKSFLEKSTGTINRET